ncbi:hypothetical protein [Brevundimonas aurifodinae]|uniref:Bacterial Ig domain-containing protein n=2 Tax=Brevundimonas TaxID=41275 RepID=A0ABV1NP31_9CAUL|nr:MAG: hypothetical protein B7Z42_09605 [Brevundimonas sp. 12-68-7]OYX31212.1 MAG: hypothetical protein B7Z01_13000 [Brevundimonas subvibrioides]
MKRSIVLLITAGLSVAACGDDAPGPAASNAEKAWVTPPVIETAEIQGSSLVIGGAASPSGRIVLVAPGGRVFAAAADNRGRFSLVTPKPAADTLFTAEVQVGQARYPAPGRLLVSAGPGGPIAFVSAGAPTRRFDPAPVLDAVDSDGRATFLSGRGRASAVVTVTAGVQRPIEVGADGRWSAAPAGLPSVVVVDGQSFVPSIGAEGEDGLSATPGGWRLIWTAPGGARQATWFPAGQAETSP